MLMPEIFAPLLVFRVMVAPVNPFIQETLSGILKAGVSLKKTI